MWRHTPSGGLVGAILHGRGAYVLSPFGADRSARRILIQCRALRPAPSRQVRGIRRIDSNLHVLSPDADEDEMRLGISMFLSGEEELVVKFEVALPNVLDDVPSRGSSISMLS